MDKRGRIKTEKKEITKFKKERLEELNRRIVRKNKYYKEDMEELKTKIEMLEAMIPRENLNDFYNKFCRLSKDERTNTKIAQMLNEIGGKC